MLKSIFKFSGPVILSQLGYVVMGMVDLFFLGKINSTVLAAGILATQVHLMSLVFCMGFGYALTPWIQQFRYSHPALWNFQTLVAAFTGLLIAGFFIALTPLIIACFAFFQQPPEVIQAAIPFLWILQWSLLPLSLFFSCKQAAEAFEKTKYALWISLLGNGINALANPVMIFGTSFIPAFGYQGSAYATLGSRLIMGIAFMLILKPSWPQLIKTFQTSEFLKFKALYRCFLVPGWHTAWQVTFELTAFTAAGLMCGFLGKTALDAHGLVLSWASFSFMVAQGISTAGVVYVSGYLAQKKWKTMALYIKFQSRWVLFIMLGFALLFIALRWTLPRLFSSDQDIVLLASQLMWVLAAFQCFDGLQVNLSAYLRGLQDTRWPMVLTFVGYWLISIPLSYVFGFVLHGKALGIWLGLLSGLAFMAAAFWFRLRWLMRHRFNSNLQGS